MEASHGVPLSMVFTVALYVPWCRYLAFSGWGHSQLFADNLECITKDDRALLVAAHVTDGSIRAVGQEASLGKSVLLSTSKATRGRMKYWDFSSGDRGWAVKIDIRDLGGHLDATRRARAGTLTNRVTKAASQVSHG